ncbi:MAG: LPS-assembly protein LptD, partial [Steroidobacteraceae bacterium]
SLSCAGDGRGARIIDFPTPVLSRRFIALLATAGLLPQAAADECIWPARDDLPAAAAPAADGISNTGPEELPVQVKSGGAELTREGDAKLTDGVVIRQGEREVSAESAIYDASERRFDVEGDVEYRSPDLRLKGGTGSWHSRGSGEFTGAEFELPQRPARGSAELLEMTTEGELKLRDVSFTSCPAGNEDWELRASAIDIDQKKQQGKGRNVRIDLKGIPILYTPVISFPVGEARKSGFLFPSFGNSDKSGFELGVPYYFNVAPNYDLTLTPYLLSRRGAGLGAEFRYLTERTRGEFDTRFLPGDDLAGRDRRLSNLWHRTDLSERLRIDASLEDASDSRYFEDFGLGPDGTSITFLDRHIHLAWLGRGWRLDGRAQDFQTIDLSTDPLARPYSRLPQLAFSSLWPVGGGFSAALDAESTWFEREFGTTGLRTDATPRVAWTMRGPGLHIEPSAAWRLTAYQLSDLPPALDDAPDRSAPVLSLDAGLVFEREAGSRNQLVQTLEPRMRYTWIPFRDQADLPVFDTALPDLNLVQLFRTNRYVGADRLGDANELAAGLTTRFVRAESGQQYLTATIGQRFYFESPRVVLPGEVPETRSASNLVGEIELTAWRDWSARLAMEWDGEQSNTKRGEASVQYRPRPDSVVNLGYRYREGLLEQWDFGLAWRLTPSWQLYARQVYSTKENKSIDRFAGFEYGGCCWRIRLLGRNYVSNRTGESDNSVLLQVELTGLSSVGTRNDTFLERGIRGYSSGSAATLP